MGANLAGWMLQSKFSSRNRVSMMDGEALGKASYPFIVWWMGTAGR